MLTFVKTFGYDKLNAMCHITGGGFHGNMKRVLPENMIDPKNYPDKSLITSLENFEKHLEYFSKNYELVSLDEIITIKDEGRAHR